MGTLTPNQMFDHSLVVIKGPPLMNRLDFSVAPLSTETIYEGDVCSLNISGAAIQGCPVGSRAWRPMPLFAIQGINDFDANSDVGNISGGVMSFVVATGGFEIETTSYVTTNTYHPNDLLKPAIGADKGDVTKGTMSPYKNEMFCGVVSVGAATNEYSKSTLRFWTIYLPAGEDSGNSSSSSSSSSNSSSSSADDRQ